MISSPTIPRTLFRKVWDAHLIEQESDRPAILYIDLHLIHEVTSPQAFTALRKRGLSVRRPERTIATMDHSTPTTSLSLPIADKLAEAQLNTLRRNCEEYGVKLYELGDERQGIVHVIAPELGLTQPGMTIVCGDSHTSTHGAFGALTFGIGTTEVEHVLASQCLLQNRPKTFEVQVDGQLGPGVTAKDIILALIASIGIGGGTGHVFEYRGQAIRALSMEQRMTICNMSIEAGARAGMIAPDSTTYEYMAEREFSPHGLKWELALGRWRKLPSDKGSTFDRSVTMDASALEPMITYGTNPGMGMPIIGKIPNPAGATDDLQRSSLEKALAYMDLRPGQTLIGHPVDVVFLGSCANSRISDLRQAATILKDRNVAKGVRMLVVPGSQQVKKQAEAEGLDLVFTQAGAEWRHAGCSMCIGLNGDQLAPGQYSVSTSNRNFEGRQGMGGRTFLTSPVTAAAAAVSGKITDPRTLLQDTIDIS